MRLASVHLLLPCAAAIAACSSSPGLLPVPAAGELALYDDLSSGTIDGARWDEGLHQIVLADQAAVLAQDIASAQPDFTHRTKLVAIPPGGGAVTTLRADVTLGAALVTGDTVARAGIEIFFQPEANRLQRPYDLTNALAARLVLNRTATGLTAWRQVFECLPDLPDCRFGQGIGVQLQPSTWSAPRDVSLGVRYTMEIDVDVAAKRINFTLSGGDLGSALAQTFDVSGVTTDAAPFPPFVPDLSAENFHYAALAVGVRGGAEGGGDGSATAEFDDVWIGVDGAPAALFDDFDAGTRFDPSRWRIGGASVEGSPTGVRVRLDQAGAPAAAALNLARKDATALQADVTVTEHAAEGTGRVAAELRSSLYNDGSNGSGTAPDVNAPSSQVGDLLAIVSMTGTDVSHAVVRCDSALCSELTFVQPFTSLGSVAPGTRHTVSARWDGASHTVIFWLDGDRSAAFDPVAAGHPIASAPRSPCKRIGVQAGPAGTSDPFAAGSSGTATAVFADVRTD